ncbi:hypothetical protein EDC17_101854 [Sphingobacterium alimentarium]|uniref:Uncharacterized protein n=1 Tax=Sphingobacterium alimentarium TaxID=797292 RepID=A0A4R3VWV7_9SPHI|nr:hypothetical protein EDC17_101854 [Sphingobacterium alimentarium]
MPPDGESYLGDFFSMAVLEHPMGYVIYHLIYESYPMKVFVFYLISVSLALLFNPITSAKSF